MSPSLTFDEMFPGPVSRKRFSDSVITLLCPLCLPNREFSHDFMTRSPQPLGEDPSVLPTSSKSSSAQSRMQQLQGGIWPWLG